MRTTLLVTSMLAGLAMAAPAFAAAMAPTYGPNPYSTKASNINSSDTHSAIAPELPSTGLSANATVAQNLAVASKALTSGQTGLAQHALENAETLALTRAVPYDAGSQPDHSPLVSNLNSALQALGRGDMAMAQHFTSLATQHAGA